MGNKSKIGIVPWIIGGVITAILLLTKRVEAAPPILPPEPGLASLSGIVTDTSTGQPMQGVSVTLGTAGTSTNSSGGYSFNNITPNSYQMTLSKSGYEAGGTMITLIEGTNVKNISMTLTPVPTATLTGVVSDATTGALLSGVKVTIAGVSTYTNDSGWYGFEGITLGTYALVFEKTGYITLTA